MTAIELYLLLKLDTIIEIAEHMVAVFLYLSAISIVAYIIASYAASNGDEEGQNVKNALKWPLRIFISIFTFSLILWTFLPSTKQMAAIIVIPNLVDAITENEELKQIPNNLTELTNDWIESMKPDNKMAAVAESDAP